MKIIVKTLMDPPPLMLIMKYQTFKIQFSFRTWLNTFKTLEILFAIMIVRFFI